MWASLHEGHFKYRLNGAKRAIAIDYLGVPVAVRVTGARTHEVRAARELLADVLPAAERVTTVMGDRGFRGLHHGASATAWLQAAAVGWLLRELPA